MLALAKRHTGLRWKTVKQNHSRDLFFRYFRVITQKTRPKEDRMHSIPSGYTYPCLSCRADSEDHCTGRRMRPLWWCSVDHSVLPTGCSECRWSCSTSTFCRWPLPWHCTGCFPRPPPLSPRPQGWKSCGTGRMRWWPRGNRGLGWGFGCLGGLIMSLFRVWQWYCVNDTTIG